MKIPKVFVSYSHDSQAHKQWVLNFATRLRQAGVDAVLDQWELGPGADIPHFMEQNLATADRVIMICTDSYVEKANAGRGGVGYEKMIITAELMRNVDSAKIIPVIRQNGARLVPTFLNSKMYLDFSLEKQFEESFDELSRSIHNAPLFIKPEISMNPFDPTAITPKRNGDAQLELMRHLVAIYEDMNEGFIPIPYAIEHWQGSRIMFEILLKQAEEDELVKIPFHGTVEITLNGKMYAIKNELIN
jgi:hypothetical protein